MDVYSPKYGSNTGWWLVSTPLKNMTSSIGMMTFPIDGKIKNLPNHQPDMFSFFELGYSKFHTIFPVDWVLFLYYTTVPSHYIQ